jgi:hypothetical protein
MLAPAAVRISLPSVRVSLVDYLAAAATAGDQHDFGDGSDAVLELLRDCVWSALEECPAAAAGDGTDQLNPRAPPPEAVEAAVFALQSGVCEFIAAVTACDFVRAREMTANASDKRV